MNKKIILFLIIILIGIFGCSRKYCEKPIFILNVIKSEYQSKKCMICESYVVLYTEDSMYTFPVTGKRINIVENGIVEVYRSCSIFDDNYYFKNIKKIDKGRIKKEKKRK